MKLTEQHLKHFRYPSDAEKQLISRIAPYITRKALQHRHFYNNFVCLIITIAYLVLRYESVIANKKVLHFLCFLIALFLLNLSFSLRQYTKNKLLVKDILVGDYRVADGCLDSIYEGRSERGKDDDIVCYGHIVDDLDANITFWITYKVRTAMIGWNSMVLTPVGLGKHPNAVSFLAITNGKNHAIIGLANSSNDSIDGSGLIPWIAYKC